MIKKSLLIKNPFTLNLLEFLQNFFVYIKCLNALYDEIIGKDYEQGIVVFIAIITSTNKQTKLLMKFQQKDSLWILQKQIKEELLKMPTPSLQRKSLDLRHTLGGNPQHQIFKSGLKKMRSLNSMNLDSTRKRQVSMTSTRIPESAKPLILRSAVQEDKNKQKVTAKIEEKGKLKKKISKQQSPKPFMKLKRVETMPDDYSPIHFGTTRQRIGLNSPITPKKRLQPLTVEQYQQIIEKQRILIDKLQKIIVSFDED